MNADPRKIKIFLMVAETGSITEAAKKLYRTQSAITHQIKSLEDELGVLLFDRSNRKVSLTREGASLQQRAKPIIHHLDDIILDITGKHQQLSGKVRLGIHQDLHQVLLAPIIQKFNREFPKIRFEISTGNDHFIEQELLANNIDFGFIVNFREKHLFHSQPAFFFQETIYGSQKHQSSVLTFDDILTLPKIDFTENFNCIKTFVQKFSPNHLKGLNKQKPAYVVPYHSVVATLISSDVGIGLVPDHVAENFPGLVPLMPDRFLNVTVDLAWKRDLHLRHYEKSFISVVKANH